MYKYVYAVYQFGLSVSKLMPAHVRNAASILFNFTLFLSLSLSKKSKHFPLHLPLSFIVDLLCMWQVSDIFLHVFMHIYLYMSCLTYLYPPPHTHTHTPPPLPHMHTLCFSRRSELLKGTPSEKVPWVLLIGKGEKKKNNLIAVFHSWKMWVYVMIKVSWLDDCPARQKLLTLRFSGVAKTLLQFSWMLYMW